MKITTAVIIGHDLQELLGQSLRVTSSRLAFPTAIRKMIYQAAEKPETNAMRAIF